MARGADLFVVCKNCGSEVSPYVTECPYGGQRVRKRAPKIERGAPKRAPRAAKPRAPRLSRLRRDDTPRLRPDPLTRPYVTIALVAASFAACLLAAAGGLHPYSLIPRGFGEPS